MRLIPSPTRAIPSFVLALSLAATPLAAQDGRTLELSFTPDGTVTLVAADVSLRDILAEWTRAGGSRFINAERLPASPLAVPLQFENRPETEVLAALLRSAAGYIVSPRLEGQPGISRVGAVYIVATSTATAAPTTFAPAFSSAPVPLVGGSPDDELPPVVPPGLSNAGQPTPQQPPSASQPSSPFVGGPGGVFGSRTPAPAPGATTPAPESPAQPTPPPATAPSGTPQPAPIVPVVPIVPIGN